MSVVAEYSMGADGLFLERTLDELDVVLEVERVYARDPERPIPFAWVETDDHETFATTAESDPTVASCRQVSDAGRRRLYRFELSAGTETVLYPVWIELSGERLTARFEDGRWHSRIRFPDREVLAAYERFVNDAGLEFELQRLYDDGATRGPFASADGLTPEQRETVRLAYERGLYEVPRRATVNDLAEELDISRQAVSERLRRAHERLVEGYLDS